MNYLLLIVCGILAVSMFAGYRKGFIRYAVSIGASIATIVLVAFAAPYVSEAIIKYTPVDDMIKSKIIEMVLPKEADLNTSDIANGLSQAAEWIGSEQVDALKGMLSSVDLPLQMQIDAIQQADIPDFLKQGLLDNNNNEVYKVLGVQNFVEYVAAYIVKLIVNIIAFLITFIVVRILFKILILSLGIFTELPVIHGINRIAGAGLGIVAGVIVIWIGFLIITLLYSTEIGKLCFQYIEENQFLGFLYNHNMILNALSTIR